jgi:hypothetical protein
MKLRQRTHRYISILTITGILLFSFGSSVFLPGQSLAIRPGEEQEQSPQSPQSPSGSAFPEVPEKRDERPMMSSPVETRKIVEQPHATMQIQKRYADTFLPNSVRYVTDPQDGLTKDGRVAVLEGLNAQIAYQFSGSKVINVPNQPDVTIYTNDQGGFDGPFDVFVANFGDSTWSQLGMNVIGTSSFDLPPSVNSVELVLIINRHAGATYIEAIEGFTRAGGTMQGTFTYIPEELIGLRAERLDYSEIERARLLLTGTRRGYQLAPLGEIEIRWNSPIQNVWKKEEFFIEAEGEYEVYASDSRGMESLIGRRFGTQGIDLPQDMLDAATVRIRNHNMDRPVMIYSILGRR